MRLLPSLDSPMGSWLLGSEREGRFKRRVRIQVLLTVFIVSANVIGVAILLALVAFVVPGPDVLRDTQFLIPNFVVVPAYVGLALLIGILWGTKRALKDLRWSREGEEPTPKEQRTALATPWRLTVIQFVLWGLATVLFTVLYGVIEPDAIAKIAFTVAAAGIVVCAISYLLSEFALRPIAAEALAAGDRPRRRVGTVGRSLAGWCLGTGVPVAGLMIIAIAAAIRDDVEIKQLIIAILALGAIVLCFGLLMEILTALRTIAPIRLVRAAMHRVEEGDLDAKVVVFDGTELGDLQVGFNRMADGLRDRERMRDIFGRHVGRAVAEKALSDRAELGGEERNVAVFFIDVIGSTTLAANNPPKEVVALLNRFFAVIVEEVDSHGGFINKFEGDAALAIFGAPTELNDPAGSALAAARKIMNRLKREVPDCEAGIGVAYGRAVAGNVGAHERFEYTVIGDPVNEAARLSDLSKKVPGCTVASRETIDAAKKSEAKKWASYDRVTLRGRNRETELVIPQEFLKSKAASTPS
ncbi:adenylate/guanylate cyclase domain-containing protein [Hoyosella altamirensis]|uniref:Adenylate cyclase n=1 Tax=Hoyosella altamirensis TaxID=616997 RepID=A0A839RIG8_9ACTN|nr:adenylate/guanylate cyclase domain-containing protein [Hoyosella altamirensis]MBB3036177.1 adenylate cyclase [Hoyosella altamirensis]